MAKINLTTTERIVWQGAEGRAVVVRHGSKDYEAKLDGKSCGYFEYSFQAEHELGVLLHEQAEDLAVQLADEAADDHSTTIEVSVVPAVEDGDLLGQTFVAGSVEVFVADGPVSAGDPDADPTVFIDGRDGVRLSMLERAIPSLAAILTDSRFRAARTELLARLERAA